MAAFASSFLRKELFESLVMACKCPDLTSKMGALPFMPLVHNVFTCDNAFGTFEKEGGKIVKDNQLVYLGECCVSIFGHSQVFFDLFLQFLPSLDFTLVLCPLHWAFFFGIEKEFHVPFFHI